VRANVATYRRLIDDLDAAGGPVGETLAARWPDLLDEVEGIAAGAGVPVDALLAIQARTELLGGAECSLIGRAGRLEQTWDWHPDVVPLVWVVEQPGGRWFATLTEAGILGKIGVSSAGLCFGLNFLRCSLDGGLDGVPVHVLLRMLLDRVDTLEDAVALLVSTRVSASSCITIASAGEVVAVEVSPAGCEVFRRPRILHTNHFLHEPAQGQDLELAGETTTLTRLRELERTGSLAGVRCDVDPDVPWADRIATLATVAIQPGRLAVEDRAGARIEVP
jgi:isopenicillin-N N-acyltransferase-like protein